MVMLLVVVLLLLLLRFKQHCTHHSHPATLWTRECSISSYSKANRVSTFRNNNNNNTMYHYNNTVRKGTGYTARFDIANRSNESTTTRTHIEHATFTLRYFHRQRLLIHHIKLHNANAIKQNNTIIFYPSDYRRMPRLRTPRTDITTELSFYISYFIS